MKILKLSVVIIISLISYISQGQDGIIKGKIIDYNNPNIGVFNVKVLIETPDGSQTQVYTRPNGEFVIKAPFIKKNDNLILSVSKKNYYTPDPEDLNVCVGKQTFVIIHLQSLETALTQGLDNHEIGLTTLKGNTESKSYKISHNKSKILAKLDKNSPIYTQVIKGNIDTAKKILNQETESTYQDLKGLTNSENNYFKKLDELYNKAALQKLFLNYAKADTLYNAVVSKAPLNLKYLFGYADFVIIDKFTDTIENRKILKLLLIFPHKNIKSDDLLFELNNLIGISYKNLDLLDSARFYYLKNINLLNTTKTSDVKNSAVSIGITYNNIGTTYFNRDDSLAFLYFSMAKDKLNEINDTKTPNNASLKAIVFNNLGQDYYINGAKLLTQQAYQSALNALSNSSSTTDEIIKSSITSRIAYNNITFELNPTKNAMAKNRPFLDSINLYNKKYNGMFNESEAEYSINLANNFNSIGLIDSAKKYYKYAINLDRKLVNDTDRMIDKNLANYYIGYAQVMNKQQFLDSAKTFAIRFGNMVELAFSSTSDEYYLERSDYYLQIANIALLKKDTAQYLKFISNAKDLLAQDQRPNNSITEEKILINNTLYNFYDSNDLDNAIELKTENLGFYKFLRNNFRYRLDVASNAKQLAWDKELLFSRKKMSITDMSDVIGLLSMEINIINTYLKGDSIFYSRILGYDNYLIANVYFSLNNEKEYIKHYRTAIELYNRSSKDALQYYDKYNISSIAYELGNTEPYNESSLKFLRTDLQYLKSNEDIEMSPQERLLNTAKVYNSIGIYYLHTSQNDSSKIYYNYAFKILDTTKETNLDCLACWIANRDNMLSGNYSDSAKMEVYKQNVYLLKNTIGFDNLGHYFAPKNIRILRNDFLTLSDLYFNHEKVDTAISLIYDYLKILYEYPVGQTLDTLAYNYGYNSLGFYYTVENQPEKALQYLNTCIKNYLLEDLASYNYENLVYAYLFDNNFKMVKRTITFFLKKYPNHLQQFTSSMKSDFKLYSDKKFDPVLLAKLNEYTSQTLQIKLDSISN